SRGAALDRPPTPRPMPHAFALLRSPRHRVAVAALLLATALPAAAQPVDPLVTTVRAYRMSHAREILERFAAFLALPNEANDSVNIRRNADFLMTELARRGIATRRLESPGAPPAVYGELRVPGAKRTVLLYAHYDGQPVRAIEWKTNAWQPVLLDGRLEDGAREHPLTDGADPSRESWRLYARSASDDKAPIIAMLTALDALRDAKVPLTTNLKFFFEGEEEAGSSHLRAVLSANRGLLASDVLLFFDGPRHQSGAMQVVFGVRGSYGVSLTAYGPVRPLHSGHYGNWAPNPALRLARLIASMRDDDGTILIPGFYDDVRALSAAERAALATVPDVDAALREELLLGGTEAKGAALVERITRPALNVRGFASGGVGSAATNAVPTIARASIDFRLVPNQTPARIRQLVEAHARAQGWHVVGDTADVTPALRRQHDKILVADFAEGGYPAQRTALDEPIAREVVRVVQRAVGDSVALLPTLGGSLPLAIFAEVLKTPIITVPTVNYDNSQHAPNENVRLKEFWQSIEIVAVVMAGMGVTP
ncbi:MAG: M20/M25/M40 family metallo-hydrolase, partial [Gemmatimonadaceae bacterium]|nr:M20/M25/M40 family metallo-hydrolase [Gemmatimonadaceae bacterium]